MRKILLVVALLCATWMSKAQNASFIQGKITDSKSQPLVGASVVYSLGIATMTDDQGNFKLGGLPAQAQVSITYSYTGYASMNMSYDLTQGGASDLRIALKSDGLALNEVVVTGSSSGKSKLASSVSVSSIRFDEAAKVAPRTTAEIFRALPGIKAEASGGDGNTNITVRGVPISSGGSKYLQLQEDGLPVLMLGDIAFATADIFLRADPGISRIEAIRGGSASTLASNAPAGIINFISKTGQTEGGTVALTSGLDFNQTRAEFSYGAPIGQGLSFHASGFYRLGEGPRTAGFTANNGGQLKMNLTKQFKKGYVRLYAKYLNDRAAAYMPMPLEVTGTNDNPTYRSVEGFDAKYGALQSPYLNQSFGLGSDGQRRRVNVQDGMHPQSSSLGLEFNFDLGDGWRFENRARVSSNTGRFVAPFPASAGATGDMLSTIASAKGWDLTGATLRDAVTGANFTGSRAMIIHMFDTELDNFNNFFNDFKLKKKIAGAEFQFGYFKAHQQINMSWLWNSYLTTLSGNGLRPLNIVNSANQLMTQGGQFAYGVPVWGNCCTRSYDTRMDVSAPYATINVDASAALSLEASVRWDIGRVTGTYAGAAQSQVDMNQDGTIQPNETSVSAINHAAASPVNYRYTNTSFSAGANYKLTASSALFARASTGYTAKGDRILFTPNVFADGRAAGVRDQLTQIELGYKRNFNQGGLFVTAFYGRVKEAGGFEATTQRVIENNYESFGLEIEGVYAPSRNFDVRGSLTYTKAEITDGGNKGNLPRRQSPIIYTLTPTYTKNQFSIGASIIGTGFSYAQDDNQLKMKGYALVHPFISYRFNQQFVLSVNGNNIFNSIGITESEEGSITPNQVNIIRARSVMGRTISATVAFNF
jgi:outer membrane receptor protein involved in Fe transport